MKILFVAPYAPTPVRVRTYQIVRHLAKIGQHVCVAALEADHYGYAEKAYAELSELGVELHLVPHSRSRGAAQVLQAMPSRTPLWVAYCQSPAMERLIRRLTSEQSFEIAHVEHLRAAHFSRALPEDLPMVWDALDCITALQRRMSEYPGISGTGRLIAKIETTRLADYETELVRRATRNAVTTALEAADLRALSGGHLSPVKVIPNGVDTEYFDPGPQHANRPDSRNVLFTGKLSYGPNRDGAQWLLDRIFPKLKSRIPDSTLTMAGSGAPVTLLRRAKPDAGIQIFGATEDLRPLFRNAAVFACPLHVAVGIQNKILEALAMSLPVVSTPIAARAFRPLVDAGVIRVANDPQGFADSCAEFLNDPAEARRLGAIGREYVLANHQWEEAARQFVRLYEEAVASGFIPRR